MLFEWLGRGIMPKIHGNQAVVKLMDKFNYSIVEMEESGYVWPVHRHGAIRYAHPLNIWTNFKVRATLTEWGKTD